jgi:C4-dicarboxylate transporter DctQ subunit
MKFLDRLEEGIITFLMGAATITIFVAVLHRYAAGLRIPGVQERLLALDFSWAQELCIFMFVWMCKFGAAYGVRTGIHAGVDVLVNRLPPLWRRQALLIALAGGVLFTGMIAVLGLSFVWQDGMHYALATGLGLDVEGLAPGATTPDLEWPTWTVYSAVPLGSFLMCFRFLQVTWKFARKGELPKHDHARIAGLDEGLE